MFHVTPHSKETEFISVPYEPRCVVVYDSESYTIHWMDNGDQHHQVQLKDLAEVTNFVNKNGLVKARMDYCKIPIQYESTTMFLVIISLDLEPTFWVVQDDTPEGCGNISTERGYFNENEATTDIIHKLKIQC